VSLFTYRSSGYFRKTCAFPVLAVLALIFFHVGTVAAQPSGDSLNLPPAGTQLAFVREGQIWLVHADGTGLVQLTDTEPGTVNTEPAWSRDGQRLAFVRQTSVGEASWGGNIYIMDADGSNVVQLTHGGGVEPTWGPDDREIAFIGGMGLSVINADATGSEEPRILLDRPGYNANPAWSPDGQTITFTSDYRAYDILYDLWAMRADGTCCWTILEGPFFWNDGLRFYFQSAWSPDGQSIAVVGCTWAWENCYPDSAIAVVNTDGSGLREIAQTGGYASPTWSPDGNWIAYGSTLCSSCGSSIRFVSVDGGVEGLLMDDGHSPAWRPDPDIQNAPGDPDGPIKEPDEPAPDDPKDPPPPRLPECGSKCDERGKLTGAATPDEQ
jgi:Tol biopolymer transport system component